MVVELVQQRVLASDLHQMRITSHKPRSSIGGDRAIERIGSQITSPNGAVTAKSAHIDLKVLQYERSGLHAVHVHEVMLTVAQPNAAHARHQPVALVECKLMIFRSPKGCRTSCQRPVLTTIHSKSDRVNGVAVARHRRQ